ncbi:CatA-like O-acetyltransferase [Treponema sp.]|uniref:CatA-like O-acetyltransferase n=1 Tax=Treponema sp. TaxID=166 RepID=UPI00388D02DA
MECKIIDLSTYKRLPVFKLFNRMENPFLSVTLKMDVKKAVEFSKRRGVSFYTVFIHIVSIAANRIPEFRQRIYNDGIIEYDNCISSNIEILDDNSYSYCYLNHNMDWDSYLKYADEERKKSRKNPTSLENTDILNFIYLNGISMRHYEHLTLPYMSSRDSNPRISWGRYEEDFKGRLMIPITIQIHHAVVDVYQIDLFYKMVEEEISKLAAI